MAVADIGKVTARILWLISGRSTAATFNTTVGNDNFILEEIQRAQIETESELVRDLAESFHPKRASFLAWSADLSNGDLIPEHIGQIEAIQIKAVSGGTFAPAESTTRENIKLWRENYQNVYDAIAHNATGSSLAGFYNLTNQTLTFTGFAAQAKICVFVPNYATPAHQISNEFESGLISGTIPKLLKIGVPTALVQNYTSEYARIRGAIRQGLQSMPEINVAQRAE